MYNRNTKVGWKIKDLLKRIDFKLGTPLPRANYKIRELPATGSKKKGEISCVPIVDDAGARSSLQVKPFFVSNSQDVSDPSGNCCDPSGNCFDASGNLCDSSGNCC